VVTVVLRMLKPWVNPGGWKAWEVVLAKVKSTWPWADCDQYPLQMSGVSCPIMENRKRLQESDGGVIFRRTLSAYSGKSSDIEAIAGIVRAELLGAAELMTSQTQADPR
jgi:hypothetical protein